MAGLALLRTADRKARLAPLPARRPTSPRLETAAGAFGNQAHLRRLTASAPALQAKLTVGAANDPLEREADAAADQVMGMARPDIAVTGDAPGLRRKCAACEDEADTAVRPKSTSSSSAGGGEAPAIVGEVLGGSGQALDTASRAFFEPRFGTDFSGVRIHADGEAARSAAAVNARAYTVGEHIVLGAGGAEPRLLAHELAHVIQQRGGTDDPAVRRQADPTMPLDLNMPAFPCDHGAGVELCNTTRDSMGAPNMSECMQNSKAIIDACAGDKSECLPRAKCALCDCLGRRYCQCTGIV
jgi:hypothetical protein